MAYKGKSIKEIMNLIGDGKMFLPSIQRKFVWNDYSVIKLLDSMMLGFPIGTFLFWKIKRRQAKENKYIFYKFINDYSELNNKNINEKAPDGLPGESEYIYSVLDGQQRLTSLYIAFHGSITMCGYRKKKNKIENYIKREVYLNLSKEVGLEVEDEDLKYEFKFLSENEVEEDKTKFPNKKWYKIKDVFDFDDNNTKLIDYIYKNKLSEIEIHNLTRLFEIVKASGDDSIINYYEIDENVSFNNILNIFVRVNDGGQKLSKSDLLFSTIVSSWEKGRELIEELISIINKKGQGFNFDNDFIMRTCLYLMSSSSELKMENLGTDNIKAIKSNWEKIKQSVIAAVEMLETFGFCSENLVSRNVVIPVIYYLYKDGKTDNKSRNELRKYLIIAQVKQLFGAAGNSALTKIKKELDNHQLNKDGFNLEYFKDLKFVSQRDFSINEEFLDVILDYEKSSPYTFMILSLLYSEIKMNEVSWHQDHMHPYSKFSTRNLKSFGLIDDEVEKWKSMGNKLPNLQLLEGKANESKNDMSLEDWIKKGNTDKYLPLNISYKLDNFEEFYTKRKDILKKALKEIFNIK